jgi:hypothetical protein
MESGDVPDGRLHDVAELLHCGRIELVGVEPMKRGDASDHPMTSLLGRTRDSRRPEWHLELRDAPDLS